MTSSSDVLVVIIESHDDAWASLREADQIRNDALTAEQLISQARHSSPPFTHERTMLRNFALGLLNGVHTPAERLCSDGHQPLTPPALRLQICVFLTAYQLLSDSNRLAVLASTNSAPAVLFSDLPTLLAADAPRPEPSAAGAVAAGLRVVLGVPILSAHILRRA